MKKKPKLNSYQVRWTVRNTTYVFAKSHEEAEAKALTGGTRLNGGTSLVLDVECTEASHEQAETERR